MKNIEELAMLPLKDDKKIKRVEIIILKFKEPEIEIKCIKHIIENTKHPYKLNVFDNRLNPANTAKIWNKLIRESTCDYVLIMDSDVFVPKTNPDWLTRLMETFDKKEDCWVVVPSVTVTSCRQQRSSQSLLYPQKPEKLQEILAAQCVLYKKKIFDKIGYFDEDFYLYGQDSLFGHKLLKSSYNIYLRKDVLVEHVGSYSINKNSGNGFDRATDMAYAKALFKKKII